MRSTWTGGGALAFESDEVGPAITPGDTRSFDRLSARFEGPLFNYANRIVCCATKAEEIVRSTFARARGTLVANHPEGLGSRAVRPLLFRIARSLAFGENGETESPLDEPIESVDDDRLGSLVPGGNPLGARERETLENAIASLPAEARELIVLRFMEAMSYAEIARCTGASEDDLRKRVFRSLKLLRRALSDDEGTHGV